MIAWLKGKVIDVDDNEIVIDINGVGYRVLIGRNMKLLEALNPGDETELAIYTSVKEDGIRLFGFQNFFIRKVFVLLLSVNGIGPKVALNIVDQLGINDIVKALRTGDAIMFTKVSGVGKKTAQRIILDLQGKLELLQFSGYEDESSGGIGGQADLPEQEQIFSDAVSALTNLGFSVKAAETAIIKYLTPDASLDDIIRKCLSDLKKRA